MGFQKWIKTGLLALLLLAVLFLGLKILDIVLGLLLFGWTAVLCFSLLGLPWLIYSHFTGEKLGEFVGYHIDTALGVGVFFLLPACLILLDQTFVHPYLTKQILLWQCDERCNGELAGWDWMERRLKKIDAIEASEKGKLITKETIQAEWDRGEDAKDDCEYADSSAFRRGCLAYRDAVYLMDDGPPSLFKLLDK